jgi:hypothetical protein
MLHSWDLYNEENVSPFFWVTIAQAHVPLFKWTKEFSFLNTPNFDPTHMPIVRVIHKINHDTYKPKTAPDVHLNMDLNVIFYATKICIH